MTIAMETIKHARTSQPADGNHQITLQELATQIIESMAFAEEQIATFAVGGSR